VLVLGATGFIGRWVARALSAVPLELVLAGRDRAAATAIFERYGVRGRIEIADLADADQVRGLLERTRPAVTFNLAGYGVDPGEQDREALYRLNSQLPGIVAEFMTAHPHGNWNGQLLVNAGSGIEYGSVAGTVAETTTPRPETDYAKSKLAGTEAVTRIAKRGHSRRLSTARLFTVYGPGEHEGRLLPTIRRAADTGTPVDLTAGTQERDFTYVEDAAEAMLRIGSLREAEQVINVGTGENVSVREFAETAAGVFSIDRGLLRFGALESRPSEMKAARTDISRLYRLTGWKPARTVIEGIQAACERERELASSSTGVSVGQ
jgi:nucleoside-diphosphate-sugar epimerase